MACIAETVSESDSQPPSLASTVPIDLTGSHDGTTIVKKKAAKKVCPCVSVNDNWAGSLLMFEIPGYVTLEEEKVEDKKRSCCCRTHG